MSKVAFPGCRLPTKVKVRIIAVLIKHP